VRLPFLPVALGLVALYGFAQIVWGERIPLTGGLGTYDGRRYGEIAMDFEGQVIVDGLDAFRLQRVAPSALVYLVLTVLRLPRDSPHVVLAFLLGNWMLQLGLVAIWAGLASRAGLGERGKWLGFCLLFLSFANLKQPYFYPVLTDTPGMFLGALMIDLYLRGRSHALLAVLLAAAFTWPALFVSGSLLYVLGRAPVEERAAPKRSRIVVAVATVLALLGLRAALLGLSLDSAAAAGSLAFMAVYVFGVAMSLFKSASLIEARSCLRSVHPGRLLVILAAFVAIRLLTASASTAPGMTLGRHLRHVFLYNVERPGLFLIAHAVYFGPVALLAILLWPGVRDAAYRLGLGATAFLGFQLAHSINAESRQLVDGLPAYVLLVTLAAEARGWTAGRTWLVAALGLLASKAWLPINQGEWGNAFAFPAQLYFMNMGPSMSRTALYAQSVAVAGALFSLWVMTGQRQAPTTRT
jgi:hypothetical protein